jgi:hypothetical protein
MVQVSVTASVQVAGGPTMALGTTIGPDLYAFASEDVDAQHDPTVNLLPDGGSVVLFAVNALTRTGDPASVTITPVHAGHADGPSITVEGSLVVANKDVLAVLMADGPRSVKLHTESADAVTVDVLVGYDNA